VYSRPVSADKLYNLTGLFSERTANGFIRYAAGKYDNLNAAVNAKNGIVNTGIRDAFVTAYFNGQRISVERAQELERGGEKPVGGSQANTNNANIPSTNNSTTSNTNNSTTSNTNNSNNSNTNNSATNNSTPLPVVTNTKPNVPDTGTVFAVQLGAYRESVPIDQANRFFLFASRGISIYKDANTGLTVYQVGVLKSYDDANSLKNEAVTSGITDAFIVAWRDGQKISVEEVLKR
jgi:cell division septation protein DedD